VIDDHKNGTKLELQGQPIAVLALLLYRFIAQVEEVPNGGAAPEPAPTPSPKPRRWRYAVLIVVVFASLAGLLYRFAAPNIAQLYRLRQPQQLTVVPLTALPGNVEAPTFSPDGSQIAFAWDGGNEGKGYDLYVKAIGTEKPLRLTHHPAIRLSAAWSQDGRSIAISRVNVAEEDGGIYLLPPTGGPERKIATRGNVSGWGNEISWSPMENTWRILMTERIQNQVSAYGCTY
jgi:Tol biopolymer transport system component